MIKSNLMIGRNIAEGNFLGKTQEDAEHQSVLGRASYLLNTGGRIQRVRTAFLATKIYGVDEPALTYPKGHGLKLKYPRRNTASASKNFFQSCFMVGISSERSDHAISAKLSNLIRQVSQ